MTQQLVQTPFSTNNYTQGGQRLMVKELVEGGTDKGFRYLGNIHTLNWAQAVEFFEHYSAASGQEVKDYEAPNKTGVSISFTADEITTENLKRFLMSGEPDDVAENLIAAASPQQVLAGKTDELHGLDYGRQTAAQRGDLVVYNVTDAADLVEDTDYEVVTLFGWTFIKMLVDTHAGDVLKIGEGINAADDYHYKELAAKRIKPMTVVKMEVAAILEMPALKGKNWAWRIWKANLKPAGEFSWSSKEASSIKFSLEVLSDAVNHSATPFGEALDYGFDDAGGALI